MERKNKIIVCIFLIVFLVVTVVPVSAVTVQFVDKAYLENNDYKITDNTGTTVTSFNGSSSVTLTPGKSYSVMFKPNGLFDFSKEQAGSFTSLNTTFGFFKDNLAGLIVLAGLIGFAVMTRH